MRHKKLYYNKLIRLKNWDYRSKGAYFITIGAKNMHHYFGKVVNHCVHLSEMGQIAERHWQEIPSHYERVSLGNYIVMPNHIHGIIFLNGHFEYDSRPRHKIESFAADEIHSSRRMSAIAPKAGSISTIIRSYKSGVSREARKLNSKFGWISRFHDHVVRSEEDLKRINDYISKNPIRWSSRNLNH